MDTISKYVDKAHLIEALHGNLLVIKANHLENSLTVGNVSRLGTFEINIVKFEICGCIFLTSPYDNVCSTLNTDTFLVLGEANTPNYIIRD